MAGGPPWRATERGLALWVRLTPKAARDEVVGLGEAGGGAVLVARVRAVPEQGAANAALAKLVADWLGVPRSTVTLEAGGKSRVKVLAITGASAVLSARLEVLLAATGAAT